MPVLKPETSLFPETLLADGWEPAEQGAVWWAIHTLPRAEKSLARKLCRQGIPFYLPLYERRTRRQRQVIRSYLPLFPGYLFVVANETQRASVFQTNLVANCLKVEEQQRLRNDLQVILGLCTSGETLRPEQKLQPGTSAEITSGPLKGYRGTVLRAGSGMRFVVEVDFLQSGASVEVDVDSIRPL